MMKDVEALKKAAADKAVEDVTSGMVVGLGHGSTTIWALRRIAERLKDGSLTNIIGVPCSLAVETDARELGIPLSTLNDTPKVDLTIDGADEIDAHNNLIKGGGGALLREKVVAQASSREIIIADAGKLSTKLGEKWAVPVEVVPFALESEAEFLRSIGAEPKVRMVKDMGMFTTDQGNHIIDANFGEIADPHALAEKLNARAGIMEHGLFLDIASKVIVADEDGVRVIE
jgi:ribose 5-phosphate isomerase A